MLAKVVCVISYFNLQTPIAPATVPVPIVEVLQSAQESALQLDLKAVEHVAKPVQSVVPNHNQSQRHSAVAQAHVVHPAVESVHVPVVVPAHAPIHTEIVHVVEHVVEPLAVVSSDRPAVPLVSPTGISIVYCLDLLASVGLVLSKLVFPTEGASPASECLSPGCRLAEPVPEADVNAAGMLVWSPDALMKYRHIPVCVMHHFVICFIFVVYIYIFLCVYSLCIFMYIIHC